MRRTCRPFAAVVLSAAAIVTRSTLAGADERAEEKQACASTAEDAEQLRIDGRLRAAREHLLQCSRSECPATVRRDCIQWMTEVAAAIPTVVLAVRDARGQDVLNAHVWVDGASIMHGLEGKPLELDPGVHRFRFESAGTVVEQVVLVREGEKGRAITATLDLSRVVPATPSQSSPSAVTVSEPSPSTSTFRVSPWTWALGGIGIVAIGIGAYLEISVNADASQLQSTCGHSCSHGQVDPLVLKQQVFGPVAFGVGALSLGAATYTLFAAPVRGGAATGVAGRF
jgi:hypothetical protein